jgi:beta-xylosidase
VIHFNQLLCGIAVLTLGCSGLFARDAYLFAGFQNNGAEGIYFALSEDGRHWELLNKGRPVVPTQKVGELMRDPHLTRGPEGEFHMVWTWSWNNPAVVGHAHSRDLLHWSEHEMLPVMAKLPAARNVWAPELYWEKDKARWLVIWSSTVPKKTGDAEKNHRIYFATTRDFKSFSDPKIFFDPGFSVIDATLLPANGKYYLFFKDEREEPLKKFLQLATGPTMEGPWSGFSEPLTEAWNEGPSAIRIGDDYLVYFDHYRKPRHYSAIQSKDLQHWKPAEPPVGLPDGLRHGTFLRISAAEAAQLRR